MPHINTEQGGHDQTVSAFIVRVEQGEPRLLLHRHKLLGVYLQFGGHIERTESPWQAITHELTEESGYDLDQLNIIQPMKRLSHLTDVTLHPIPMVYYTHKFAGGDEHFHTDMAYGFVAREEPRGAVGAGESSQLRLFSLGELEALADKEIFEDVREIGQFMIKVCLPNWEEVSTSIYK